MKKIFFVFIFLIFSNNVFSIENQKGELNNLFDKLKITNNNLSAKKIENEIWKLWTTHPSKPTLTDLLAKGSYYMSQNQLNNAYKLFSKIIKLDPEWAEAWNKRATVLSIRSFIIRISFAICAPIFGYLADNYSLNITFYTLAIIVGVFSVLSAIRLNRLENKASFAS